MGARFEAADARLGAARGGAREARLHSTSQPQQVAKAILLLVLLAGIGALAYGTGYDYRPVVSVKAASLAIDVPSEPAALRTLNSRLERRQRQLQATLARKAPRGIYIVIDQTQNRLYLMKDDLVLHEAVCSAGSGMILKENAGGGRRWVFDTPRGNFHVLNKLADPIWKKPDWAFVEEGQPIPKNDADRFDPAALGEYALYFGNGYMIHGTLYERLLGRSVTHGCIRLGRDDLREVYKSAPIGTPIYIY